MSTATASRKPGQQVRAAIKSCACMPRHVQHFAGTRQATVYRLLACNGEHGDAVPLSVVAHAKAQNTVPAVTSVCSSRNHGLHGRFVQAHGCHGTWMPRVGALSACVCTSNRGTSWGEGLPLQGSLWKSSTGTNQFQLQLLAQHFGLKRRKRLAFKTSSQCVYDHNTDTFTSSFHHIYEDCKLGVRSFIACASKRTRRGNRMGPRSQQQQQTMQHRRKEQGYLTL